MQVIPEWCPFIDGYSVQSTIPRIPINLDPEKLVQNDVHCPWGSSQVSAQRGPNVRYMAGPLAVTLSCPVIISLSLGLSSLGC